jgi:hypothetical protein
MKRFVLCRGPGRCFQGRYVHFSLRGAKACAKDKNVSGIVPSPIWFMGGLFAVSMG